MTRHWCEDLVGELFDAWDGYRYRATRYTREAGLWVIRVDPVTEEVVPDAVERPISERAIDRTFHRRTWRNLEPVVRSSSLTRIAARLRERLPEVDGWRIVVGEAVDVYDNQGRHAGGAWCRGGRAWQTTGAYGGTSSGRNIYAGSGWPDALADSLASALLTMGSESHVSER